MANDATLATWSIEPLEERCLLAASPHVLTAALITNASRMRGSQVEAQIAINPANPSNIVTVAENTATGGSTILISRSIDGGRTWQPTTFGGAQDHYNASASRPDARVAFDAFGNCFVTYIVGVATNEIRVLAAQSSDGGRTFKVVAAAQGSGTLADSPAIAAGIDARNHSRQTIWISYTDFSDGYIRVVHCTTTGLGQFYRWSAPEVVSGEPGGISWVAVGPQGQVSVTWQTPANGAGPDMIYVCTDPDGAGTTYDFGADIAAARTNVGGEYYIPAQPNRLIDAAPQVAYDRSTGSGRGRLYLVYVDSNGPGSADTDIVMRHSDDSGKTWSSPIWVNDDTGHNSQFLPALAVDDRTGQVGVGWMDARNNAANVTAQAYAAISLDHGASFLANVRVSAASRPRQGNMDYGDTTGAAFYNGRLLVAWADNSNSTGDNPDGRNNLFDIYTALVR